MIVKPIISTMNKKSIDDLSLEEKGISSALIINQSKIKLKESTKNNYRMLTFLEKGLSKSRNRGIEQIDSKTDVVVITDDDVSFVRDYEKTISSAYKKIKDADIIVFMSKDDNGNPRKKYNKEIKRLNSFDILSVNSIEITFKIKTIREKKLMFDEDFGLGSKYKSGEENIFLSDALKKGLKIYFYPEYINIHPIESTGFTWGKSDVFDKGALFKRLYPILSYFFGFLMLFLKRETWSSNMNCMTFLSNYYKGLIKYKRSR